MTNDADSAESPLDSDKHSRRERFRDVLSRTKSKFKKERVSQDDFKLNDDVEDFLAAGRHPVALNPSPDVLLTHNPEPRPSTSDSNRGRPSSRGGPVPKLDVSQSQRWPGARPVGVPSRSHSGHHLYPGRSERSQSAGVLRKEGARSRGLSVTFVNTPPVIIGEGGDEAEAPTVEISMAKQRSRSLSPLANRPSSIQSNTSDGQSPIRRKPIPSSPTRVLGVQPMVQSPVQIPLHSTVQNEGVFMPKPIRRIQTGFQDVDDQPKSSPVESLEAQLQHALNIEHSDTEDYFTPPHAEQPIYVPPPPQPFKVFNPGHSPTGNTQVSPQQPHHQQQRFYASQPQSPQNIARHSPQISPVINGSTVVAKSTSDDDYLRKIPRVQHQQEPPGGWI